jgi:hypothetical protein
MLGRRAFVTLVSLAVLGVPGSARADAAVVAEVVLESDRTRVGQGVRVSFVVRREGAGDLPDPEVPESIAAAFDVVDSGTASSREAMIINGDIKTVARRTLTCTLVPRRAGKFELRFTVESGGERIASNEATLEVVDAEAPTADASGKPIEAIGDLFPWAVTDKSRAYVGEQILFRLDVYERRRFLNVNLRTPPSFQDFYTIELPDASEAYEQIAGIDYHVRPGIRRALFPQRAGKLVIGPAEVSVGLRRRERSAPLEIEVLPLPAEGQPKGFSAANVGRFTLASAVDKLRVAVGEPLTLTVDIEGTGNIELVDPGAWPDIDGARRYDPKIEIRMLPDAPVGGTRSYSFLVIPERPGTLRIPAHELGFFDPEPGQYAQARSEPIEIEVYGQAEPVDEKADGASEEGVPLAEPIVGEALARTHARDPWLTPSRWTWGMLAPPLFTAAGLVADAAWRRFGPDDSARARARERMRQRLRIEAARDAVESGEGFHATVARLLQELAVARAGTDGVGLPRPELVKLLEQRGVAREDLRKLGELLDRCDAARFAAQRGNVDERLAMLDEVLAMVRDSTLARGGTS